MNLFEYKKSGLQGQVRNQGHCGNQTVKERIQEPEYRIQFRIRDSPLAQFTLNG